MACIHKVSQPQSFGPLAAVLVVVCIVCFILFVPVDLIFGAPDAPQPPALQPNGSLVTVKIYTCM